jgi:DNA-directed RNA polymerase specialized sigma24 family protein
MYSVNQERNGRLRDGDLPEVIEQAYDGFAAGLYRYALLLLVDHAGAEDAVHEVFLKLARLGRRAGNIKCVEAYLQTAVRNECYRILKQRKPTIAMDAAILETTDPS